MDTPTPRSSRWPLTLAGAVLLLAIGAAGGSLWRAKRPADDAAAPRAGIEQVVHDYILAHPEVLRQAIEGEQQQQTGKTLAALAGKLETPFIGAVLGNPAGRVTLVEFTDFGGGYCRQSVADVDALIAANPDLRVVVRQLPIITPQSADAARMGLAAAEQGHYPAFHKAMYEAGGVDAASIAAAAQAAGLDPARAQGFLADPRVSAEIDANRAYARDLGIQGTPAWVVGRQLIVGAVGREALAQAIAAARKS